MITGDRREAAIAITRDAGILKEDTDIVWTSDDLSRLSDQQVRGIPSPSTCCGPSSSDG